jgi:tetratricopeptide (TPR) repeat protein
MALCDHAGAIQDFSIAIRVWEFPGGLQKFLTLEQPKAEYIDSYRSRGVARGHLNDWDGAVADLTTAMRLRKDDARLHYERGYLAEKAGRAAEAVADYFRAGLIYSDEGAKSLVRKCASALERLGAETRAQSLTERLSRQASQDEDWDLP